MSHDAFFRAILANADIDALRLPPYRPEEDEPHGRLPAEYVAQRKKQPKGR